MAAPKTTKYSEVVMTGVSRLWKSVRKARPISVRYSAQTPCPLKAK
jgi:hypothetical protein